MVRTAIRVMTILSLAGLSLVPAAEPIAVAQPRIDPNPAGRAAETGMAKDLRLLRKTILDSGDRVSSPDAFHAAARIFGRVRFVGMSKKDVLWMLGNPETVNDFGLKPGPGEDDSFIYRFDQGNRGRCYFVEFEKGRVVRTSKPRRRETAPRPVDAEVKPRQTDTDMSTDLRLLRKTVVAAESGERLSSQQARQAAHRIFGRVNFVGMTRANVLWMLGDPANLSDFTKNYRPKLGKNASLRYAFFNDAGGRCYILNFENDKVTRVHGIRNTSVAR